MIPTSIELADTIGAIAHARYVALARTNALISDASGEAANSPERLQTLYGLVTSSLEELKVAEEELRLQSSVLDAQRATVDNRVRHYRELFEYMPVPALVTDIYAAIREVNLAAIGLFNRDPRQLDGKPITVFLAEGYREDFHEKLRRVQTSDGVRDWRLVIKRPRDVPMEVRASITLVPNIGETGSGLL